MPASAPPSSQPQPQPQSHSQSHSKREISLEELAKHNQVTDCWMAIQGKVYDCTDYVKLHPGGCATIMIGAGTDASALYDEVHSYLYPDSYLKGKVVGVLKKEDPGMSKKKGSQSKSE